MHAHHDHSHHGHEHGHGHGHDHGHHHGHSHAPASFGRAFAIGVTLNAVFVGVEAGYGLAAGSMALVADAGHNLSDVLGLLIAWTASVLANRPPSARFTYGFKSSSILAALANAAMLLVAVGAIGVEAVRHLIRPEPVAGGVVMAVAAVGIAVNTFTALLFMGGRHHDINIRGAFLHMAGDALVSAAVVLAGFLIQRTGQTWIDPAASLLVLGVISWSTWGLLGSALRLGLAGVPDGVDHSAVKAFLLSHGGVSAVHDLHIWPMSTTETALTAHLVMPGGHPGDAFLHGLAHELAHDFAIHHTTIQLETGAGEDCVLESDQVV